MRVGVGVQPWNREGGGGPEWLCWIAAFGGNDQRSDALGIGSAAADVRMTICTASDGSSPVRGTVVAAETQTTDSSFSHHDSGLRLFLP